MADAPAAAPTAAPKDEFEDAFNQITLDLDTPVVKGKPDGIADEADAAGAARAEAAAAAKPTIEIEGALPDPTKVKADGTVDGEIIPLEKKDEPAKKEPEPAKSAVPSADDLLERFRGIVKEEIKPAPQPAPAAPAAEELTPEQKTAVDTYLREFPDVYMAEQIIRKGEYKALVEFVFDQLRPHIQGLQSQTQTLVQQTAAEQLLSRVPDYDEVREPVIAWVAEQPAYLKAAYDQVVKAGTVDDIVDLIGRYKAAKGIAPTPAAPQLEAPAAAAAAAAKPVDKLAARLAPVKSVRTGVVTGGITADDFDGAFDAFAKAS